MKHLFIVVNVDWFFLSHRLPIALAAKSSGWNVTIIAADTGQFDQIKSYGLKAINLPMSRSGMNIFEELNTLKFLYKLYKKEKPDVVHHVGMKTILWGTLAARFAQVKGVVNAISGLGGFFADDNKGLLSKLLPSVLRFSHNRKNLLCIFQNNDDWNLYVKHRIISHDQGRFIKGSGVDLNKFSYTPEPDKGKIRVILTARMIAEKGIFLLTEAAERLRKKYEPQVEFLLVGGLDDHPGAITKEQLDAVCDGNYIKWLGYRSDIPSLLRQCHIMAFPSHWFYHDRLLAAPEVRYRGILDYDNAITWIDTAALDFKEKNVADGTGRINLGEAGLLIRHLRSYMERIGEKRILDEHIDFGIISPYRAQVRYLRQLLYKEPFFRPFRSLLTVHTVDGFQGQERDVVFVSLVRANEEGQIGFLRDLRRMNVAITRARMKLVILGDAVTLARHPFYKALYDYIGKLNHFNEEGV